MTCQELSEFYTLYALGVLDGPEKEAVEEHLGRNCETCMNEMNHAVENNSLVFRAVPRMNPPPGLRARILAGFGLETRPFWIRVMPWVIAFAAVAVLVVGYSGRSHQGSAASAMEFLGAPGTRQVRFGDNGPHGSVLVHEQKGMLLVVANLPVAPAGKMYETWIVPRDGDPQPTGQLTPEKNGDAVGLIPGPIDASAIKAIAVSLEPTGARPVKPTELVFAAPLGS